MENPKLDPIEKIAGSVGAKAIRVYEISELMKEIDSSIERGEKPTLLVLKRFNPKRGVSEVEIAFWGQKHIEKLYADTSSWNPDRWGYIILSLDNAVALRNLLEFIIEGEMVQARVRQDREELPQIEPKFKFWVIKETANMSKIRHPYKTDFCRE